MDRDNFKSEVARKNNIILDDDDPIMVIHTSNQMLLHKYEKGIEKNNEKQREFITEISEKFNSSIKETSIKWSDETRETSEKIISVTLDAGRKAIREEIEKGEKELRTLMREQLGNLISEREKFIKKQDKNHSYVIPCLIFSSGLLLGALAEYIALRGVPFL